MVDVKQAMLTVDDLRTDVELSNLAGTEPCDNNSDAAMFLARI
ncbi:hypothetical protein [Paraburkholderia bryophila]|uniref:Uncharacterized protein n=1 Tax=Paraburkholderia bryophila TaxID=420952 RepID=A0A7Y9WB51_9BURK|nr:hypothetical protein [Paraburkholderia bryophila]NYH16733.1 hypothetical protein [Paraburkholderia bryophila]